MQQRVPGQFVALPLRAAGVGRLGQLPAWRKEVGVGRVCCSLCCGLYVCMVDALACTSACVSTESLCTFRIAMHERRFMQVVGWSALGLAWLVGRGAAV